MNILSAIFTIWFFTIIVLNFFSTKWSVALFIAYSILVPMIQINVGISIGSRFCYLILFGLFIGKYYHRLKEIDLGRFYPFIFLFLARGVLIPLQDGVPFLYALDHYISDTLAVIIYPFAVYTLVILEKDCWALFKNTLLICGGIFVAYGIFLTTMPGINPYLMAALPIFGQEFNEAYALGYSTLAEHYSSSTADGRLFGRISSVFIHPMTYGLNLGLLAMIVFSQFRNNLKIFIPCILLISVAVFTSGIRTPIAALGATVLLILLYMRNFKYVLYGAIGTTGIYLFIITLLPSLQDFALSIIDSDSRNVSGSSINMRIDQLYGCFDIIKYNLLEGMGYDWTMYYMADKVVHPVLLAFESVIYVVLCNQGLLGMGIWTIFIGWLIYDIRGFTDLTSRAMLLGILAYYLIFSTITGEYGYMKYFILYYIVAIGFCYHQHEDEFEEYEYEDESTTETLN